MIMMLTLLNIIVSNFSTIERSVLVWLLGTFFGNYRVFQHFLSLIPKNVTEKLSEYFLLFLLFFKLQNN